VKKFGEVFTPKHIVDKLLDGIDYSNPDLTICEPSFGDGRILLEVKTRLLEYHSEEHIMNNMLFGIEIQEAWYRETLERLNPNNYNHNLLCCSALNFEGIFNPLKDWINKFDYVLGNPPYNRNILKKEEVTSIFWEPSGYTTKLAYCCFVVLAQYILKPKGQVRYVMPCSFTHNENTEQFREFTKKNLNILSIEILPQNAFEGIMIRTCIFMAINEPQVGEIELKRVWNNQTYYTSTYYNEYNEIPLFIGNISKQIYDKVMKLNHKLTAYKGWNGVDSYAKFSSSDPNKYEYQYVDGVKKEVPIIHSTKYSDKVKASVNKKRNNVGNYDRFHHKKLLINEVMFNSFEVTNHIKYFIKDELGEYGSSPKHTVIVFDDENMDSYINDLSSQLTQLMLTVMKDYNHNDSKLFRYLPYGISNVELTQEEESLVNLFNETPNDKIYSLEGG
jgi:type I restriction-modification system DNA methylase subunit